MLSSWFLDISLFSIYCISWKLMRKNNVKYTLVHMKTAKKKCSINTYSNTHHLPPTLSEPPHVLGYSVKQTEPEQKSEGCLCAHFLFHFPWLSGTGGTNPNTCGGFSPLCLGCECGRGEG